MPSLALGGPRRPAAVASVLLAAWLLARPEAAHAAPPARPPWTNSRVSGTPGTPPPYRVVRAYPNLKFEHPVLIVGYPGGGRIVVGEQAGVLRSFVDDPGVAQADLFLDLRSELNPEARPAGAKGVEAVYGLAFHPDFERNRACFVCYTLRGSDRPNLEDGTRVSRFKVTTADPPRIDPASEEVLLTFLQGGHNGGDLRFGPDGMLYISAGDAGTPNPPDPFDTGQDLSDLLASILRIDVDRRDAGKGYAIPGDNPFVGVEGARPEVWAYGLRNPWRMGFDRETGELFAGDVGWELWESIHRIERGGNYGWPAMEGPQPIKGGPAGPSPIRPALIELPHTVACSITGGLVYRGRDLPELRGAYLFGDWETRRLWAARFDGDRAREMPEIARPSIRFIAFGEDRRGEPLFLDHDGGTIHALARSDEGPGNDRFPASLSETGLFASTRDHRPSEGVVPFAVNARQWQDGATEEHWAAFPGQSAATLHAKGKPIPGLVDWHRFRMHFPKDAVLMRTLSLAGRRQETQMLHYDGVDWHGYSFAWRPDQSDADLVPAEGSEREVQDGGRTRLWQFQSRGQCLSCHSNQSEYALAFLPEQLNRPGLDGRNQLVALTEAGYIRRAGDDGRDLPPFDAASAAREPRVPDPADASRTPEERARGYLHANCGHCHSDNGGGSVPLRLSWSTPPGRMNAIGARPTRGNFGLPDAQIIRPGDPHASTLYYRMAKFGRDRMPHIGSEWPDESGLELVERWIAGMGGGDPGPAPAPVARPDDMPNAQRLARRIGRGELAGPDRDAALASAASLPHGPIRDLFEGYLPSDGPGVRKLGANPRPRAILALAGDPARGERQFWSQEARCSACHRVGDRGTPVGPDLTAIGTLRSREDLLESLLEPSRRIDPKYATYAVATADGRSLAGLMVERDARRLVLRDAQGREIALAAGDVEEVRPSRSSLMPDGQLAGLTAEEAADLLAYLASLGSGGPGPRK
ncbi:PQQ-dependent sugar dehydrogenase (plasmid) [Tundrisphaera sp. TA3]|uniref:PQQ-dependent sugar dehydrogenase n=1 Tax=Tundrisphaera sp. TA3 TaxID=3435775 RepID=UPI003EBD04FD